MNILHICVAGTYTDDMSYQENLLTKYHVKSGNHTTLLASEWMYEDSGKVIKSLQKEYTNSDGVQILRLPIIGNHGIYYRFKRFEGFYETIKKCNPEIIFVHNIQFIDVEQIKKYAKNHKVTIYVDNHADFSNSGRNALSRYLLHGIVWRHMARIINPYTTKFYGVLPARVEWLVNMYGLPKEKCELLVMGADDEEVTRAADAKIGNAVRSKFGINEDEFLIVTGGKINAAKTQTLLLMQAVQEMKNPKIRLLVFGSVADNMKEKFESMVDGQKVQYMGWVKGNDSYDVFSAADLVVFPGRHSVFWEQVCGQGKPMLVKYWEGTTHIDLGGNVEFLYRDSVDEIYEKIMEIVESPEKYENMRVVAESKGMEIFSYKKIAERAISD